MTQYKDHLDQELFERIEAYLLHTLDTNSRVAFERDMEADELLRNEVTLQRKLIAAMEVSASAEAFQGNIHPTKKATVKKILRMVGYAAAATIIIAAVWFYRYTKATPEKIFARYFTPDTGLPVVMSSMNDDYEFYDGMVSYKEGNFHNAITSWKKLYQHKATNDTLQYFIGMAYLNENDKQAIDYLIQVAGNDNSRWRAKATWYLVLAYTRYNDTGNALKWLESLQHGEQTEQLKEDIKKLSP